MSTKEKQIHRFVAAQAYVAEQDEDDYWFEGDPATVEVSREDDLIRIGLLTEPGMSEDAGIYLNESEALRLIAALGAVIHEDRS